MKKYFFYGMLLAMGMASCSKAASEGEALEPSIEQLPDGSRRITLYADSDPIQETDTKTTYASDQTFSWVAGDKISVLFHNSSDEPVWVDFEASTSAASSSFTATVSGELTLGAPTSGTFWALYPANANHVYTDDDHIQFYLPDTHEGTTARIPMIAKATGTPAFHFRHLGGALKITVKNIRSEVSNIRVQFNSHGWSGAKYVAGLFDVQDPGTSTPTILGTPSTEYVATYITNATAAVDGSHNAVVYIPLPKFEVWPSIEFSVYDADKNVVLYNKTMTSGGLQFYVRRQQICRLNDLTLADVDRSSKIQVDGYFDEWGTADGVVSKTWPGTVDTQPFELKVASDGTNIWFYHAFDGSKVDLSYSGYLELYMDTDNNAATGDPDLWFAKGADKNLVYDYSLSTGKPKTTFYFHRWETPSYDEGTSKYVWSNTGGSAPASVSWAAYQNEDNDMFFEWGAPIASFGFTAGQTIRFGFVARKPQATSVNSLLSFTIPTPAAP